MSIRNRLFLLRVLIPETKVRTYKTRMMGYRYMKFCLFIALFSLSTFAQMGTK